jgi:putative FmdB family regulatory protein
MTIYEYRCSSCGQQFEKLVKIDAPSPPCSQCASDDVKKLVSASSFVLKGSGWYSDHYGLKSGAANSESESSGDSSSESASPSADTSSKSDSKPAATGKSTTPSDT